MLTIYCKLITEGTKHCWLSMTQPLHLASSTSQDIGARWSNIKVHPHDMHTQIGEGNTRLSQPLDRSGIWNRAIANKNKNCPEIAVSDIRLCLAFVSKWNVENENLTFVGIERPVCFLVSSWPLSGPLLSCWILRSLDIHWIEGHTQDDNKSMLHTGWQPMQIILTHG